MREIIEVTNELAFVTLGTSVFILIFRTMIEM